MAKGKKSKGNHYISKGTHCQDKSFYKKLKREWKEKHPIEYYANLVEEWRKGNTHGSQLIIQTRMTLVHVRFGSVLMIFGVIGKENTS